MTNFLESIETGMKIALDRERNFMEIHQIFSSVKDQILNYSKNNITLEMVVQGVDTPEHDEYIDYFKNNEYLYNDKFVFISLVNHLNDYYEKLTSLNFSTNGYPCTVQIDGNQFDAMDKVGLEECLKNLLSSPSTGQKLFKLMKIAGKV